MVKNSRSDLYKKLKKLNPNSNIKWNTSTKKSLTKEINNIRRKQIIFKNELKVQVKKYKNFTKLKRDIKIFKDFFKSPIDNKTIIVNKNSYKQLIRLMKFYPEYHLLESDGITTKTRKPYDNFNINQLQEGVKYGSDTDIDYELLNNRVDNIEFKWRKISRQRANGAFFPYYNNTNLNLEILQIYKENVEQSKYNCLQHALFKGGLKNIEFKKLLTFFIKNTENCNLSKNDYIPKCKLKDIANFLNIRIELTTLRNKGDTKIEYFGDKKNRVYKIGLLNNHYFIRKNITISYKDLGIKSHKKNIRPIDSFKLVRYLLDHKDTLLIPLNYHNNKTTYDFEELKNYNELIEPNYCAENKLCEKKCTCGSTLQDINQTDVKIPSIFYDRIKDETVEFTFGYFDFEATTDGETHKPYQLAFEHRDGEKRFFEGKHCALNFLKSIKSHMILYAHNLKYDLQFIVRSLSNIKDFIKTGSQFKTISGEFYNKDTNKYYKLCFKDSMSLIPESLGKFGSMFNLKQEKEIIPYKLYSNKNILKNSIKIDEALKHIKEINKKQFIDNIDNWNLRINKNEFKHLEYSKIYCIRDVEVLKSGFEIMKRWMFEITKIDIDYILSLPHLSYKFGVNSGVYDECIKLAGQPREFIQRALVGGRTMTRNNKKLHIKDDVADPDANSLYPSAMVRMNGVLKGSPKVLQSNELNMDFLNSVDGYFIEIDIIDIPIKRNFPLLSSNNKGESRNFNNDIRGSHYIDKFGLEDAIKFQDIKFKIIRGYYYNEGRNNKIKEFIEDLYNERKIKKNERNPIEKCYKLLLNAFYGKTIQNPIYKNYKFIYGKEKSMNHFLFNTATMISSTKISEELYMLEEHKAIHNHFSLPQVGIEILSVSKRIMNEVICLAEDLDIKMYYQDTDSIQMEDGKIDELSIEYKKLYNKDLMGKELGQFSSDFDNTSTDRPAVSKESIYLGKKCYINKISCLNNGVETFEYHCRMKGIPSSCIKNFQCKNLSSSSNKSYDNVLDIYKDLYNKEIIEFELIDKLAFKYNKNFTFSHYDEFKRKIAFV